MVLVEHFPRTTLGIYIMKVMTTLARRRDTNDVVPTHGLMLAAPLMVGSGGAEGERISPSFGALVTGSRYPYQVVTDVGTFVHQSCHFSDFSDFSDEAYLQSELHSP